MDQNKCNGVYIPNKGKQSKCPDGYFSGSCVTVETCIPGFFNGNVNDAFDHLYGIVKNQSREVALLRQTVESLCSEVEKLKIEIENLK